MGIIVFGAKSVPIGIDEHMIYCQSCEGNCMADVMILSTYFHIYYLPLFPVAKEVNIVCQTCGLKNYGLPLNEKVLSNAAELKRKFRHPWYTYIFPGLVILLIVITIVS
ncbi:MAG: hypothetical protein ABI683_06595 [Ginsengibacter sp.]